METLLWFFAVAIGPFLLGGAMVYALMRQRPLTRREKAAQDKKVAELYSEEGRNE